MYKQLNKDEVLHLIADTRMVGEAEVVVATAEGGNIKHFRAVSNVRLSKGVIVLDATREVDISVAIRAGANPIVPNISLDWSPDEANTSSKPLSLDSKPLDIQVGGAHYKNFKIQPVEFCEINKLTTCPSNIIKYACRMGTKGDRKQIIDDANKIKHYVDLWLEINGYLD